MTTKYIPYQYTLDDLAHKIVFTHSEYPIEQHHVVFDFNEKDSEVLTHLTSLLLYRLENEDKNYNLHFKGSYSIKDSDTKKGILPNESKGNNLVEELCERYSNKFGLNVYQYSKNDDDVFLSIMDIAKRRMYTGMVLGDFNLNDTYIDPEFKEFVRDLIPQLNINLETGDLNRTPLNETLSLIKNKLETDGTRYLKTHFSTQITIFTTDLEKTMDSIYTNTFLVNLTDSDLRATDFKFHIIYTTRDKDLITVSNHIIDTKFIPSKLEGNLDFLENFYTQFTFNWSNLGQMESNIPRYSTSHNYALNYIQATLLFNEFNLSLTTKKTEHRQIVYDLNSGNVHKEFEF